MPTTIFLRNTIRTLEPRSTMTTILGAVGAEETIWLIHNDFAPIWIMEVYNIFDILSPLKQVIKIKLQLMYKQCFPIDCVCVVSLKMPQFSIIHMVTMKNIILETGQNDRIITYHM